MHVQPRIVVRRVSSDCAQPLIDDTSQVSVCGVGKATLADPGSWVVGHS